MKTYTTFKIASLMNVYPSTVSGWIDKGKLPGFTTPGGHRRVKDTDLRHFIRKRGMPVPPELEVHNGILIVDDDPHILAILGRGLTKAFPDTEIAKAADGFQAGRQIEAFRPELVILDIMLPGLNGIEVCAFIKENYPETKVIAVTGYDTEANRKGMLDAGSDSYLAKPFELYQLLPEITALCGKKPAYVFEAH